MSREERIKEIIKAYPDFGKGKEAKLLVVDELHDINQTAYIKGMRHLANALKKYDREKGAWTDYFEHTVNKVLKQEIEKEKKNG